MTTTFRAKYDQGKFEPLEPVGVRDGAVVELSVTPGPDTAAHAGASDDIAGILKSADVPEPDGGPSLTEILHKISQLPRDPQPDDADDNVGVNHDHYLYGAPKVI